MKRLKAAARLAVLGLLLMPRVLQAETFWEGNAARIRDGEITQPGLLAASNTFPRNTKIRVTNSANGRSEILTVVKRIDRVTNVMLLVSSDAALKLGIGSSDVVSVRVSIAGDQGLSVDTEVAERAYSNDPDVNPSAAAPATRSTGEAARLAATGSGTERAGAGTQSAPAETAQVERASTAGSTAGSTASPSLTAAETAPTVETPARVGSAAEASATRPADTTGRQTAPAQPATGTPATETPVATQPAQSPSIALPAANAAQDAELLDRMASRTPAKRVFTPARGPDAPETVLSREIPQVSPEVEPPGTSLAAGTGQPTLVAEQPRLGGSAAASPTARETGPFVQTERPEAARGTAPAVAAARPEPAPAASAPTEEPTELETPFVQREEPRAAPASVALSAASPQPPQAERRPEERAFVQIEQPRAAPEALALDATAPQPPEQERPPEDRAFVQTERPAATLGALEVASAAPAPPADRTAPREPAFVQSERPLTPGGAGAVAEAMPDGNARGFVQTEPAVTPPVAVAAESSAPAAPAERGRETGRVQTEQPRAEVAELAIQSTSPRAESGTDVASMVDSPSVTESEPSTLSEATLPTAPGTATERGLERLGPVDSTGAVASLGTAGAEKGPETVVSLTPTEPVPPPRGEGSAAARSAGTAGTALEAAAPASSRAGRDTPAALLAQALTRQGLPLNAYYLQVAAVASEKVAHDLADRLGSTYPSLVVLPDAADRSVYRVLVGPLGDDERGAVLYQIRSGGYKDAYLRYLN